MYRWQTIALARAEMMGRSGSDVSDAMVRSVKDVLFRVGTPHFPDPAVYLEPDGDLGRQRLVVQWIVDDRLLEFRADPDGDLSYHRADLSPGSREADGGGVDLRAGEPDVLHLAHWLVFGFVAAHVERPSP